MKWDSFLITDIAEIISGHDINDEDKQPGDYPYISSSSINNGISHFVSNINNTLEADCISVCRTGSVGYAFYHPYNALYSNNVRKLRLKVRNNKYVAFFITTMITGQRERYSYGYIMGTARLMRQKILLPVNENGKPDYAFMERFIRQREQRMIHDYIEYVRSKLCDAHHDVLSLEGVRWASFKILDIAEIVSGRDIYEDERVEGDNHT